MPYIAAFPVFSDLNLHILMKKRMYIFDVFERKQNYYTTKTTTHNTKSINDYWGGRRYTNIHAHADWDPYYSHGLCGTCKKMLFLVCTVVEWVCKVSVVDAILWATNKIRQTEAKS